MLAQNYASYKRANLKSLIEARIKKGSPELGDA